MLDFLSLSPLLLLILNLNMAAGSPGDIVFFLSNVSDTCAYNNVELSAPNNTAHGSLCAYAKDDNKVWACPAPDGICWAGASPCNGNTANQPGPNQVGCSNAGAVWCCAGEYETCTRNQDQINVCWSNFANPNKNVIVASASASGSKILASATASDPIVGSTSIPVPSQFSRTGSAATSSASAAASSSASVTSSSSMSAASSTGTGASSSPTGKKGSHNSSSSSSSISGGAIAGIVIGCVIGGILISAIIFWIWRRRHQAKTRARQTNEEQPVKYEYSAVEPSPSSPPVEAEAREVPRSPFRAELPAR